MKEESFFKSAAEEIVEKKEILKKEGGFFYLEKIDPESGETKKYVNIMGIDVETEATENEVKEIAHEIIMNKEIDQEIFPIMAQAYNLKQPLMLEGGPATGKTFNIKYFTKLLYGRGAEPLTIYGNTRTDADDILGHWAPKGAGVEDQKKWEEFLETQEGKIRLREVTEELKGKSDLPDEQRQNIIQEKLGNLAKSMGLVSVQKFEFKEGPLLKAYSAEGSRGYILDVEELGVMPTNIQETFLPIGGERGRLSDTIQFWGNGKEIYKRGEKTWIVFATNPPEETGARHVVTTPLASRMLWARLDKGKIAPKTEDIIDHLYSGGSKKPEIEEENIFIPSGEPFDFTEHKEIREALALAAKTFHTAFVSWYNSVGEIDREQKFELGPRDASRVFEAIKKLQVTDSEGEIDLIASLKRAIRIYYIERLADPKIKEEKKKLLDEILSGSTSPGHGLYKRIDDPAKTMSIEEKIKEEMQNLDPERKERALRQKKENIQEEIKNSLEGVYKIPKEVREWEDKDLKKMIAEYDKKRMELQGLEKQGLEEEDTEKGVEILKKVLEELEKFKKFAEIIKEKIKKVEKNIRELKNLLKEI